MARANLYPGYGITIPYPSHPHPRAPAPSRSEAREAGFSSPAFAWVVFKQASGFSGLRASHAHTPPHVRFCARPHICCR